MDIRFFIYRKDTGEVVLGLPNLPENNDFENPRGDIWYEKKKVLGGVNWDVCDWEYSATPIDIDFEIGKYLYDPITNEITENPNWTEGI